MADYCSSSDILAQLPESGLQSSTDYDNSIAGLITAASRAIDNAVGRWANFFYPSTGVTYLYDGNGLPELWIDEFIEIVSVKISEDGGVASSDYTTLGSSDYTAYPYTTLAARTEPAIRLDMDTLNGGYTDWPAYRRSVKITGARGYSLIPPDDVKQACIMQVIRWFNLAKQTYQGAGGGAPTGSIPTDTLDAPVRSLIWHYVVECMR